ncbi:MAG: hypothetical protein DRI37_08465 [Chloroflexi bacterium]|nr:MAG: hypothetical protein DRI37_08465 [Chloroflexota bacterium]
MEKLGQLTEFKDDQEIATFMEAHDGFDLVDQGLAEIVATPNFDRKDQALLDPETLTLLDELIAAGVCADIVDAINRAVHSYALAVLPQSYKLVRAGRAGYLQHQGEG